MRKRQNLLVACWAAFALVGLSACDGADVASRPARDHTAAEAAYAAPLSSEQADRAARSERAEPKTATIDGQPVWSDNRRYSAAQNAAYHFEQHGEELGARTVDAFVAKAHAFLNDPPAGAKTKVRWNGDRMVYDPKSGLFGVARKDGAPRTVFKPDDGAAYWAEQVSEADDRNARRTSTNNASRKRRESEEG